MDSIPISVEGYELVKKELAALQKERPEVIKAIAEAREEGDLKENAGYHAARERQGWLEAKISYINSRMPLFNIIDFSKLGGDEATYGATIEIEDIDTEEVKKYILLGPDETAYVDNGISLMSPVGMAMLGKCEGDEVIVDVPKGRVEYEVLSVTFEKPKFKAPE